MDIFKLNTSLDSSAFKSVDEFVADIVPVVETILKESFPNNKYKQSVRVHGTNRIQFACPICGDSHSDNRKKRGNIILDNGQFQYMYKCWNCGAYMNLNKFFNMYGKGLSLSSLEYIHDNKTEFTSISKDASINMLFDIEYIESLAIDRETFKNKLGLIEIKGSSAELYLVNRNQYNFEKFLYEFKTNTIYLLNLTPNNKIIGLQIRPLTKSPEAKYKTYKLSNIYSMLMHEEKEIDDIVDTLSMYFNILCVNYSKPIIVTEGPMDAFLIKNAIATCGAGKKIPIDLDFYYMYDDDKTGREKSIEKLNNGSNVFLWNKFKCDLELPSRKKWDYNDFINYSRTNNIKNINIYNYFSNDQFDIIDI